MAQKRKHKPSDLERELLIVSRKEKRLLEKRPAEFKARQALYERVPLKVRGLLEAAFEKAFWMVFSRGTGVIEKTFDREEAKLRFEAADYIVNRRPVKKALRQVEKGAKKDNLINTAATAACGAGMGLLGLGLPDIPLTVGMMLKGIYETALGYGADYESQWERIYILRLIRAALCREEERQRWNGELEDMETGGNTDRSLEEEIKITSKVLADALLVEKFIQGLPVVGAVGGAVNFCIYRKTAAWAAVKYKKRYLMGKAGGSDKA